MNKWFNEIYLNKNNGLINRNKAKLDIKLCRSFSQKRIAVT